jgi:esterase/lipase superfamily enzyme
MIPTSNGRYYQYEDFGTIKALEPFIEAEKIKIFCIDSRDWKGWYAAAHPAEKAKGQIAFERCVIQEVVPQIYKQKQEQEQEQDTYQPLISAGFSFGAYHALNFHLKHPALFRASISLSGIYTVKSYIGNYYDENIYFSDPVAYMANLTDVFYLEKLRRNKIIICAGQAEWERQFLQAGEEITAILRAKGLDVWLDAWGPDVQHDWYWWHKQLPYFLETLLKSSTS